MGESGWGVVATCRGPLLCWVFVELLSGGEASRTVSSPEEDIVGRPLLVTFTVQCLFIGFLLRPVKLQLHPPPP